MLKRIPYSPPVIPTFLALLVVASLALPVTAAQLYRYKNEQGNFVLNQTIPAEFVSKGYDILNDKGRVLQHIAPALTPEQISIRDAQVAKEEQRLAEKQKQDTFDQELKQLYSHPNDAVRILKRRVQDIQSVIQIKKRKIESAQSQILNEETDAAARKRLAGLGHAEDHRRDARDPGHLALDHAGHEAGRDAGIHRVAASLEDL